MPVLPLVESSNVRPFKFPEARASSKICSAARSLTLPPGLNHSSLAWISTPFGSSERSRTSGVLPTASASDSRITSRRPARSGSRPRGRPARRSSRSPPAWRHPGGRRGVPDVSLVHRRSAMDPAPAARRARQAPRFRAVLPRSPPGNEPPTAPPNSFRAPKPLRPAAAPGLRRRTRRAAGGARTFPVDPPSASAGDGRHDGQPVAFLERRSKALRVPYVLVILEQIHVTPQPALVVEQLVLDARVLARELVQRRLDGAGVLDGHLAQVGGQGAQRGGDLHGDRHVLRSSSCYDATGAPGIALYLQMPMCSPQCVPAAQDAGFRGRAE